MVHVDKSKVVCYVCCGNLGCRRFGERATYVSAADVWGQTQLFRLTLACYYIS